MLRPRPTCFMFDRQAAPRAFSRAWANTGKRIAAKMAIMAITTSSSIRVNPRVLPDAETMTASLQGWAHGPGQVKSQNAKGKSPGEDGLDAAGSLWVCSCPAAVGPFCVLTFDF